MRIRTIAVTTPGCLVALGVLLALCSAAPAQTVNTLVSPDLFGEQVDVVTPGFMHWSAASGDTVDPDGDANDFDNSFGEHNGSIQNPIYSSQAYAYGAGTVAEEFAYAESWSDVRWEFTVPGPGQYVFATRFWREYSGSNTAVVSYQVDGNWIALPAVTNIDHWGGFGSLSCYLIEIPSGQTVVPMRITDSTGRLLLLRMLLAKRKEADEFVAVPATSHPSMMYTAADVATLQSRIAAAGIPKISYDYMVGKTASYISAHDNNGTYWQPGQSSHTVPRSIVQTAFVYAMTGDDYYYDAVIRMIDTVMSWNASDNPIDSHTSGYWNILGRGKTISMIALAYDWMYHRMPAAKRDEIRQFLATEANRLYLYTMTFATDSGVDNWIPWIGAAHGMVATALRDDHKWPDQWLDGMKWIARINLQGSGEDFGYYNNGYTKAIYFGMALKTATGDDIFTPQATWLTRLLDYRMTLLEPGGSGYPTFGDAGSGNDPLLGLVSATYLRDPMAQWYLQNMSCGTSSQVNGWGWEHMMPVAVVTTYDPTMSVQTPDEPRLMLADRFYDDSHLSPGLSVVSVMRTGYNNADDVQLAMRSGPFMAWHGHPCQGNFTIKAYGDRLVVDKALGGSYGSAASNYSKTAGAHSQVMIDGKGQVEYSGPVYYAHEAGTTGTMTSSPYVDHVQADMTVAYAKGPLGSMQHAYRDFLFIRKAGRDAYVVVVDDLKQNSSTHSYQWLLQTDDENSAVTVAPDHHVIQGSAHLDVFTIDPASVDFSTSTNLSIWRKLALTNPQQVERGTFLNILYPRRSSTPSPEVQRIEVGQLVGFRLGDDLILFHKGTGVWQFEGLETDARIAYFESSDPQQTEFLITDATVLRFDGNDIFTSPTMTATTGSFASVPGDLEPPTILSWRSANTHGRGIGEALLQIADDGSFSEPRSTGINRLIVEFSEAIDPTSFTAASVRIAGLDANNDGVLLTGSMTAVSMRNGGTEGVITLTPALPDYARYLVVIEGVTDAAGNAIAGDLDRIVTALAGDATGDLRVNSADLLAVRDARTKLLDPNDSVRIRCDLTGDGRINVADLSCIRPGMGNDATGIADPTLP